MHVVSHGLSDARHAVCPERSRRSLTVGLGSLAAVAVCILFSSCTLITVSPHIVRQTTVPVLNDNRGLICSTAGEVPYQKWRIPPWDNDMRYVWLVGHYDFRKFNEVELIFYFHGMHSKDYFRAFSKELELLAKRRPKRPFLFVGFVDTPYVPGESRGKNRWKYLVPKEGATPQRLFKVANRIFKAFRHRFPNIKKEHTFITLAGFSGGGRVLDSVGSWLARSPSDDPYAQVFRSRLSKIAYFDCWFDRDVLEVVPALLKNHPTVKIVGTVHMAKPSKHATMLADKFKMKHRKNMNKLIGMDGRLVIFRNKSHWSAMISRLKEAL